jgi:hypothetical protein
MSESPGLRRIDAEEVNRLASELDGQPYTIQSVDDDSGVGTVPNAHEDIATELEETGPGARLFPPEDEPNDTVGGSVEDRAVLREEETR